MAKRYGRRSDIVEMAREIIEEQKLQKAFLHPECFIVTRHEALMTAQWGLIPFWVREVEQAEKMRKMTANARAETAFSQASFRTAIRKQRCLIPSTGYYEYHHIGKEAIPYEIFLKDTEVFSLAGMYEEWRHPQTKDTVRTFSVLTVPANALCSEIHNGGRNPGRMPAILPLEDEEKWLDADLSEQDIKALLRPYETTWMDAREMEKDYLRRA